MSMNFSIVKPEAGTNRILNPSIETAVTGWTAGTSSTVTRDSTASAFGAWALKIVAGAANANAYYAVTRSNGEDCTFSAYVRSSAGTVNARLVVAADDFSSQVNGAITALTTTYKRLTLTLTDAQMDALHSGGLSLNVIVMITDSSGTIYADGMQWEAVAYATTYIDGDQPGCTWTGTRHASTSTRDAQSREGGRIYTVYQAGGVTDYANGLPAHTGLGMPPMQNVQVPNAQRGGATHQGSKPGVRTITLQLGLDGSSLDNLHTKRQNLIDLVKPDLVFPSQQLFWLRYFNDDGTTAHLPVTKTVRIKCAYESGLDWSQPKGTSVEVPLRLSAPDPFWYDEVDTSVVLGYSSSISNANGILRRDSTGLWAALGTGTGASVVLCLAKMPNGDIIAGGDFTSMGGVSNTARIARWDGSTWNALGTGANGVVRALAVDAAGNLYAGGDFAAMGGVANTLNIAKWNGSAWSSISSGMTGGSQTILSLAVSGAGLLYAGGSFASINGTSANNIASYNGSAWSALSTGLGTGGTHFVYCLALDVNDNLYAGGNWTAPQTRIAKWNGSTFSALSSGLNNTPFALVIGSDGTLYAGGQFTTAGGVTVGYIAKWNGTAWTGLGSGMDALVRGLSVTSDGSVLAGGDFATAGGVALTDAFARWNGASWVLPDIDLPGGASVYAFLPNPDTSLTIAFSTRGTATGATVSTANIANGTAEIAPKVYMTGPGTFVSLINRTTGKHIQFKGFTLAAGETAVLDLTPNNQSFISSFRGSLMNFLQSAPQIADWTLLPGSNNIAAYIPGASGATALALVARCAQWSIDSVL